MLVSILIPCHNAERWVAQAIESALAQEWPEKEVVVVDDGSTDGSLGVIRRYEGRVRWETGPNRGGNAARNRLLELARGEWLQYLDADDYLLPPKVANQAEFALRHPGCDVIYSPTAWERIEGGEVVCADTEIPEPHDPWLHLALWRLPQTGGPLWRKAALVGVGGWRVDQPCCQEHELYCRLLEAGSRFEHCAGCFAVYRDWEHGPRVTRRDRAEIHRHRLAIMDRIESCLRARGELSAARRQAVNDTRHRIARDLWKTDRGFALEVLRSIRASDSSFVPARGPASPPLYSAVYRLLGFRGAQVVASWKRALASS